MSTVETPRPTTHTITNLFFRLLVILLVLGLLLFLPAGRLDWMEAWAFIGAYGLFLTAYAVWGLWKDPEQLRERSQPAQNTKGWDKVILAAYTVCLLGTFVVCGLDAGRFQWSQMPLTLKIIGWIGLAVAAALIFWSLAVNTYLSRVARIQDDRGQVVISDGPYGIVRHPMYLGIIILFLGSSLALGSWWALIPSGIISILFIIRTAKEDRMLQEELAGYKEYTHRVRYRLFPGAW